MSSLRYCDSSCGTESLHPGGAEGWGQSGPAPFPRAPAFLYVVHIHTISAGLAAPNAEVCTGEALLKGSGKVTRVLRRCCNTGWELEPGAGYLVQNPQVRRVRTAGACLQEVRLKVDFGKQKG